MNQEILQSGHTVLHPKRRVTKALLLTLFFTVFAGILSAIVPVKFTSRTDDARRAAAKQDIRNIATALQAFSDDNGRFPSSSEGLSALFNAPKNCPDWDGPYMTKPLTSDPWGHPYIYTFPGIHNPKSFDLSSSESGGHAGGSENLNNWMINLPPAK